MTVSDRGGRLARLTASPRRGERLQGGPQHLWHEASRCCATVYQYLPALDQMVNVGIADVLRLELLIPAWETPP